MENRGFHNWGFRRVRSGSRVDVVVRVFHDAEGEVAAFQRWDPSRASAAEVRLARRCCSLYLPLEERDLEAFPEIPADVTMDAGNTESAARFLDLFCSDPAFAALVRDALSAWDEFRTLGTGEAQAFFERAVREAAERLAAFRPERAAGGERVGAPAGDSEGGDSAEGAS